MARGKDDLGDRMKAYERHETGRSFLPLLPVYARIDGRSFSRFTRGMDRPFDMRMTQAMIETCAYMVQETGARIGYVQSDEISLAWRAPDYKSAIFFDGKIAKMTSVLASMATAAFTRAIRGWAPYEDRMPTFDARVLQMPVDYEVANMFLWRANDAFKNSVSMACRAHYSARQMHGKNQAAMLAMLEDAGVQFEHYPVEFREGAWVRKIRLYQDGPTGPFIRTPVRQITMPPFRLLANRTEIIFHDVPPELETLSVEERRIRGLGLPLAEV